MKAITAAAHDRIAQIHRDHPEMGVSKILFTLRPVYPEITAKHVRMLLKTLPRSSDARLAEPCIETRTEDVAVEAPETLYRITQMPDKGLGLVANCRIPAGELVISDSPLWLVSALEEATSGVISSFHKLSVDAQCQVMRLCDKASTQGAERTPEGVWRTNSIELGITLQGAVFTTASRINHSCTPNLQNHWNADLGRLELHAIRSIEAGEEMAITYTDLLANRDIRRADLKARYNFECSCNACTLKSAALSVSNTRRTKAAELQVVMQQGLMNKPFRFLHDIKLVCRDLEVEGLVGLIHEFAEAAYRISYHLGQTFLEDARVWAELAYNKAKLIYGESDKRVLRFLQWSETPAAPPSMLDDPAVQAFLDGMEILSKVGAR